MILAWVALQSGYVHASSHAGFQKWPAPVWSLAAFRPAIDDVCMQRGSVLSVDMFGNMS